MSTDIAENVTLASLQKASANRKGKRAGPPSAAPSPVKQIRMGDAPPPPSQELQPPVQLAAAVEDGTVFASTDEIVEFLATESDKQARANDEAAFLKSLRSEGMKFYLEKSLYRLSDLPVNTIVTVYSHRTETGGKWDPYPIIRGNFAREQGAELALPGRYRGKLDNRVTPFHMVYTGTVEYKGKTLQNIEFVNMATLTDTMMAQ